ncbi:hypothetical protein [Staphylococcus phage Stab21]|nr:hypothetical protein [Staphylococcus phage ESa1]BEU75418.1 hypothetical protein SNIID_0180 [Staphylococcus phage phiSNIID]VEV88814.1 hypothetical protein [Staphylococcus phage Stab21]
MKKLLILFTLASILLLSGCTPDNHEGKVLGTGEYREPTTYIKSGSVTVPVIGEMKYYVDLETDKGEDRVYLNREVYHKFDKGDDFSNVGKKVYKNDELIYKGD